MNADRPRRRPHHAGLQAAPSEDRAESDRGTDRVREILLDAKREGRSYQLRTRVIPLVTGIVLLVAGGGITAYVDPHGGLLVTVGCVVLLTSLGPEDARAVPIATAVIAVAVAFSATFDFGNFVDRMRVYTSEGPGCQAQRYYGFMLFDFVQLWSGFIALYLFHGLARHLIGRTCCQNAADEGRVPPPLTTRQLLDRLWEVIGVWYLVFSLVFTVNAIVLSVGLPAEPDRTQLRLTITGIVFFVGCGLFALSRTARRWVHAWLAATGKNMSAAAGIASLFGGAAGRLAVEVGRSRFRMISADKLGPDVFDIEKDAAWYRLTDPAVFDEVDAFVSHSWRDDPDAKWRALQAWRADFVAKNQREPRIWLDRACINQLDPSLDIPLLPIYLAGCKKLVILLGDTYLIRMWCIVELFCHTQMHETHTDPNADPDDLRRHRSALQSAEESSVQVVKVPGASPPPSDTFDVVNCACAFREDYDRLLTYIEAAAGTLPAFNERIKALFRTAYEVPVPARFRYAPAARDPQRVNVLVDNGRPPSKSKSSWAMRLRSTLPWTPVLLVMGALTAGICARAKQLEQADCARCVAHVDALPRDSAGWVVSEGRAYWFSGADGDASRAGAWAKAADTCVELGGHLVHVRDAEQERLVQCLGGPTDMEVWIGLSELAAGEPFSWAGPSGTRVPLEDDDYTNWAQTVTANPSNAAQEEFTANCVFRSHGGWYVGTCDVRRHFICERGA